MSKKLMNEQLPTPVILSKEDPRGRVLRHMRNALAAGASITLATGCTTGFGVVDPLPPPAQCRTAKTQALITPKVTRLATSPPQLSVTLDVLFDAGLTFFKGAIVRGGTLVNETTGTTYIVEPSADGGTTYDIVIPADCDDPRSGTHFSLGVKVTVDYSVTPATAVVTQVGAPDGG